MEDSAPADFFKIPPPIHTDDTGSSLPASILLDPYGYLSCRVNGTTAEGFTRDGKSILITFWAASPPRVSCFTVHCPDLKPYRLRTLPKVLYSIDDLVLLRVTICLRKASLLSNSETDHYFVYQAGTKNKTPSLKLLPIPLDHKFSDREVLLLRCRDQDMFYFAQLRRVVDFQFDDKLFDLHLYNSKTGSFSTKSMRVDYLSENYEFTYPSVALAMGGEFGSVGWVDLWRGIITCDLLREDNHSLRYVPLPLPLVSMSLKGYPLSVRNIIVLEDYIKFFEMVYQVRPGSNNGCTCGAAVGSVAATKKMKISDIGSGSNWEEDCTVEFSDIRVDSPRFVQMLPTLQRLKDTTRPTLKGLQTGYPALSLHDADVVYVMHMPDLDKDKALMIAIDMRNNIVKDVADFGSGRPIGYTYTYLQSEISKHLNIWSSSRNGSWSDAAERDGILGPCKLEVPAEGARKTAA